MTAQPLAPRPAPLAPLRIREATSAYQASPSPPIAVVGTAPLAEHELTALWLLGRVPEALLAPWRIVRWGRAGRGPGPDVREAAVALPDGTVRAGAVEVHLRPRDWDAHGHAADPAYAAVVLHLVWEQRAAALPATAGEALQPLPGGGHARTIAVAPAFRGDPERLRALLHRGPSGHEPCSSVTQRLGDDAVHDRLRHAGHARLAERTWRAAALAAEHGWHEAWRMLLERALRASAGRRFESPAARVALTTHITEALGDDPVRVLAAIARDAAPRTLIHALRADSAVGEARAAEAGWNAALPLLAAYAAAYDDLPLARATAALAAAWPAPRPYGRTLALASLLGAHRSRGGALQAQGLLPTQELWCERGGCGVCPFSGSVPLHQ